MDRKDAAIVSALAGLRARFGDAITAVDHWTEDRCAIGVARPQAPDRLVYIAVAGSGGERYDAAFEDTPEIGSELPFRDAGWHYDVDAERLAALVASHLGLDGGTGPASRPAG